MAEYIEREATIEKLNRLCERVCQYSKAQRKYMCGACPLGDAFTVIEDDIPAADVVSGRDFRDCRNELCLKCGAYTERHNGACEGCRWKA